MDNVKNQVDNVNMLTDNNNWGHLDIKVISKSQKKIIIKEIKIEIKNTKKILNHLIKNKDIIEKVIVEILHMIDKEIKNIANIQDNLKRKVSIKKTFLSIKIMKDFYMEVSNLFNNLIMKHI
jgi:hypothetical protein